jgi:pyruvate,water dikinase
MLEGILAARGEPAPALAVATLLAPCDSRLQAVDAWLAEASAAPDPLAHARAAPLWDLARHRPARLDLDAPTWGEDPAPLARALRASDRGAYQAGLARAREAQRQAEARTLARFPEDAHASVRAVLDALRRARAAQQTLNLLVGELAVGLTRMAWLRAGAALVSVGVLAEAEDVAWLTRDEARGALLGEPLPRGVVAARRAAREKAMLARPPDVLGEVDEALLADPRMAALLGHRGEDGAESPLRGLGASPGVASGRARVAASEAEVEALLPGEVLVVASLLPTWTPAMQRAAGIVTETGGILSHGAVVARELGVPAVVGVAGATRRIRSGEDVRIDGASGEVAVGKGAAIST